MTKILFICTGNIFRSMSAEYAMNKILPENSGIIVSSAGTVANIEPIHPDTLARLVHHGINPAAHKQRKVTKEILAEQDLVIAMNTDHKAYLRDTLNHNAPLFYEASHNDPRPFPDLCDIYPDWKNRPDASRDYIYQAIDTIVETVPLILKRLPELTKRP